MEEEKEQKKLKTGTSTVGIIGKNCVVIAADMQSTLGNMAIDESEKIHLINNKIALTIAGTQGDALALIRFLKTQAKLYEIERNSLMTLNAAISLISNVLNNSRYHNPYFIQFVLAGFNDNPELYATDFVGGFSKHSTYYASGSGTEFVIGFLEEKYKPNLKEEEVIKLAIKAINIAKKKDIYTGGKSIRVAVINKNGAKMISEKEIEKYLVKQEKK